MITKVFLIGFCLALAQQASSQMEDFEECRKELSYKGEVKDIGENATEADKCFMACFMKKVGELKSDGTVDVAKAKETIEKCKKTPPEMKAKRVKAVEECLTEVTIAPGTEICEAAYKHFICRKNKLK